MSKYEDEHFANMKISLFLIIGFTHFVLSCDLNITHDSPPLCPFELFRSKREVAEYTRWRAKESTPKFIVKILDEDLSTVRTKKVVAVNIQSVTKGQEKIIIGGAMVPPPTTVTTSTETVKEYTRFIPPTTTRDAEIDTGVYLAPVSPTVLDIDQFIAMLPRAKSPQRDESPPVGPKFLSRSPLALRQYAAITPVGFTRRTMIAPMTPPSTIATKSGFGKTMSPFELANSLDDIFALTRTTTEMEDFGTYVPFDDENDLGFVLTTRTKDTTTTPDTFITEFKSTTAKNEPEDYSPNTSEKSSEKFKKPNNKESDIAYSLYNNYDDNESSNKKSSEDPIDVYLDKVNKDQEEEKDADHEDLSAKSDIINKTSKIDRELLNDEDIDLKQESDSSMSIPTKIKVHPSSQQNNIISRKSKDTFRQNKTKFCSMIKLRKLNFNSPMTLPEIEAQLKHWAETSPIAKWIDITEGNFTVMENPLYMMILDDPSSGQIITAKHTVMIVAGIQGRDQHAVAAAMYVLYQLIEKSSSHNDLLSKYRFWIIPVFNPDGYDYAMTFPHRRDWAKNLRQNWVQCKGRESCESCEAYGLRCTIKPCYGVHLDRNFEYQWIDMEELRSEHPCGALHAGERQLSEVETHAFTKYMHENRSPIHTFIAFKEGEVLGVMYPYSHTKKKRAFDALYRQRASYASAAAYSINNRPYVAGQTSEFLPLYAGGIEDWVDGHLGIDNTYSIMMFRPADIYRSNLKTERVVHEAYAAMDTLVLQGKSGLTALTYNRIRRNSSQTLNSNSYLSLIPWLLTFVARSL